MDPNLKQLRGYQVRLVTDVCRATGDVLVEQPTGSGKTVEIVTLVGMQLGRRFTRAVIAAPQEQIEHAFVHRDYDRVGFPSTPGVAAPLVAVPEELIWGARQSDLGSVRRLLAYLRQPGPVDHALACTHAALNRLTPEKLPDDLSGKALFIDEAHHASADGLGQIVSLWRERGGQLFFFTATPYRGDGRPVALEGMRLFRRSLAEHMAEGFAPRQLESEIVALGKHDDTVTGSQFTGELAPPAAYVDPLVAGICRRWLDDGKPKAIVRVPPMRGGSGSLVDRLYQAFGTHGAQVLDATGTDATDKQRFLHALKTEQNRAFAASRYDVMIGIQRVLEGTDWPVCSAVYCVGMPGSLNTVVQLLGRAMRPKGADCPESQRDRARLVFFVPCAGGAALAELDLDHSRHALLTCCFLADHQVGQEWIVLREVRRGIEAALGSPADNPAAADAENEADQPLDPDIRAEVELTLAAAREQITIEGREPTLGAIVDLATRTRPDLPAPAVQRIGAEILACQPGTTGDVARQLMQEEITKRVRIDPQVKKAMEEAFNTVLHEFRGATLKESPVLGSVRRQIHHVTGGQMQEFAERLRNAAPRPLTEEQILAWADAHHHRTGEWPGQDSGSIHDAPEEKWVNINSSLRNGLRGLPGGSSLAQLLADERGVRNAKRPPPLSPGEILAWADEYHEREEQWPTCNSGAIHGVPGETWSGINAALQTGHRGLPGGSSLAKFLAQHRGRRNQKDQPSLSVEQILEWADAHYQRTGNWPKRDAGPIEGASAETWSAINTFLTAGGRGLPGGSSLPRLLAANRDVRNKADSPPLTVQQILAWADTHHERTTQWPTQESGPIVDVPGETWKAVQMALMQGLRGLPGGSSLTKLLIENRGLRSGQHLPPLTVEQILAWADAYYQRTGEWPTPDAGPVPEAPGELWSAIHGALTNGARGLPGGSSLARLLAEKRGRPNRKNQPPLTEEQILAWSDMHRQRTGEWPETMSGPVHEAPEQTWAGINAALHQGSRGLPGGSSLAQLLGQHRGKRNLANLPRLTIDQILTWADAHHERTGKYPAVQEGPVHDAPGETWSAINAALTNGIRGLPGNSSLAKLLAAHRGVPNQIDRPPLTIDQILAWADAHHQRTGEWPTRDAGSVYEAPGETWSSIRGALSQGRRGLPGGSSLAKLLAEQRGVRNAKGLPPLTVSQIGLWAEEHHNRTGRWPTRTSGTVQAAPDETWKGIYMAFYKGHRGLPAGTSLACIIKSLRPEAKRGRGSIPSS
jgi:hypothetical protein